ncbi:MAG: tRNA lysidine(34) synthetase TilS [Alphaproteobacteria bacterium]|nr:tRNA lysidine(34) synthetase TilS [Alphaproteobacteria bacterium]
MNNVFSPPQGEGIAAAVSGGADSMALLLLLKQEYPKLHALTVDHGLRRESAGEAAQVARWCEALAVPHSILRWQHDGITSGIPEKARDARYALMLEWCRAHEVKHLFTAHHLDDQIETMLLRLLRGSGLVGLSGMLPVSERDGVFLHRPLLSLPKSELIAILEKAGQAWLEDPSNHDLNFTRNALRVHLRDLTWEQKKRFHAVAESFRRFRFGLEAHVDAALAECFSSNTLNHAAFIQQPEELKIRLLHHICHRVSGNGEPVRSEKIARLRASLETGAGKHMLHGVVFCWQPPASSWLVTRTKSLN